MLKGAIRMSYDIQLVIVGPGESAREVAQRDQIGEVPYTSEARARNNTIGCRPVRTAVATTPSNFLRKFLVNWSLWASALHTTFTLAPSAGNTWNSAWHVGSPERQGHFTETPCK